MRIKGRNTGLSFRDRDAAASGLRVAVITNVIAHYREMFWRNVFSGSEVEVKVFCQSEIPGMNLKVVNDLFKDSVVEVPFWSLNKEKLSWQRLPIRLLLSEFDVFVFSGNPRVLSTLVWASVFRALGRRVIIWGQVHTAGAEGLTERIRLSWWRKFENILVYTEREADSLIHSDGFGRKLVLSVNNGLDQKGIDLQKKRWSPFELRAWQKTLNIEDRLVLLSSARLDGKNRLDLVIRALPGLIASKPDLLWCVIGDGEMEQSWKELAGQLGVSSNIIWVGALYEEEKLAPWFMSADIFVHPGAIGLSILHAFGYQLPVVTHDNLANHMPEASVLSDGVNGKTFSEGSVDDLARTLESLLEEPAIRREMGLNALDCAKESYNTDVMAERFFSMLNKVMYPEENGA